MGYKDDFKQRLEESAKAESDLTSVFLDKSKSDEERLAAFEKIGTFYKNEDIDKAILIFEDITENESMRAAAMQGLVSVIARNEDLLDKVMQILNDESASLIMRNAAMAVLKSNSFSSIILLTKLPKYNDILRNLIDSNELSLKTPALEELAQKKDGYVQKRLLEGLENPTKEITEPENAIQLLSYDLHAEHFPILRKIAENPPNKASQKEALRNLAVDPKSKELFVKILEDETKDPEVRHISAASLKIQDPKQMERISKKLITKDNENEELKTALLNTLIHTVNPEELYNDEFFAKELALVQPKIQSDNFKKIYRQYETEKKAKNNNDTLEKIKPETPKEIKKEIKKGGFISWLMNLLRTKNKDKDDEGIKV